MVSHGPAAGPAGWEGPAGKRADRTGPAETCLSGARWPGPLSRAFCAGAPTGGESWGLLGYPHVPGAALRSHYFIFSFLWGSDPKWASPEFSGFILTLVFGTHHAGCVFTDSDQRVRPGSVVILQWRGFVGRPWEGHARPREEWTGKARGVGRVGPLPGAHAQASWASGVVEPVRGSSSIP